MRRARPTMPELHARLERLRHSLARLRSNAEVGAWMRLLITDVGSSAWTPCEDLGWRAWIERHGDAVAIAVLEEFDNCLARRAAEIAAAGRCSQEPPEADEEPLSRPKRAQSAPQGLF